MTFGILLLVDIWLHTNWRIYSSIDQMLAGQASAPIFRLSGMWQTCQQTMLAGTIKDTAPEPLKISQDNYVDKINGKQLEKHPDSNLSESFT